MTDRTDMQMVEPPKRWVGPLILLLVVLAPVVILAVQNTETIEVSWLSFDWSAPQWLVITATFVAGMIGGKLFGWLWRAWRRRRRRMASEMEVIRKHTEDDE